MPKLILTYATLFVLNFSASATGNLRLLFNDTRSTEETRKLAETLQLNEISLIKIKQLTDQKYKDLDQASAAFQNDQALKNQKLREIEANYTSSVKQNLSPAQQELYKAYLQAASTSLASAQ